MPPQFQTVWVDQFKGLNDSVSPGSSQNLTHDLKNVKLQHGFYRGRGGLTRYLGITAPSLENLLGLFAYNRVAGTNSIVRLQSSSVQVLNTGTVAWDDITGDAINGANTMLPQATTIDDILVFTNQSDKPQKWEGTGFTTAIAAGTSPYGKSIESYVGFLFLGNVSDNGTFTDVVDGQRIIRYSDDWDNDWTLCTGNELNLDETPGGIQAMRTLGKDCICFKTDALIKVTWTGGAIRFRQERMLTDVGCLAALSVQKVGEAGLIFLGTDAVLYLVTGDGLIRPLSYDGLQNTLPPILVNGNLSTARSMVDAKNSTYYLFYSSTHTDPADQDKDSWISYNYRTGELSKGSFNLPGGISGMYAMQEYRPTSTSDPVLLASEALRVDQFDSGALDVSSHVERYFTTGWQSMHEEGWFRGARIILKRDPSVRLSVSVARDFENQFKYEMPLTCKGKFANADFIELRYQPPPTIFGKYFNLKVRLFHNYDTTLSEVRRVGLEIGPLHSTEVSSVTRGGQSPAGNVK